MASKRQTLMSKDNSIILFNQKEVRRHWDDDAEFWYFSIIDVISVLTSTTNPKRYWSDLKTKLKQEGSEVYDNIVRLKMVAPDGKRRETDCFNTEDLLRTIQSIPSPKAETSTTEISKKKKPEGLSQNKAIAKQGGKVAKAARTEIESKIGESVISSNNMVKKLDK